MNGLTVDGTAATVTFSDLEIGRQYVVVVTPLPGSATFGSELSTSIGRGSQSSAFVVILGVPTYPEATATFVEPPAICQLCEDHDAMDNYWGGYLDVVGWGIDESPPPVALDLPVQSITVTLTNEVADPNVAFAVTVWVNVGGDADGWARPRSVSAGWAPS